jgi:short subunit dehydrogenase-like uncharacterized protein
VEHQRGLPAQKLSLGEEAAIAARALIYGANGYTGRLITRYAAQYGIAPILAGRNEAAVAELAGAHGLEGRAFALDDARRLDDALRDVDVVLHCAGPFSRTAQPMVDACLRRRAHYLDITGEIEVMELMASKDAAARAAGIMIMPGTGFDVVPSDCLALQLKERLPSATQLMLGIRGTGALSHGTATTMVEHRARGGLVRRNGKLQRVPIAWRSRTIDYGDGKARMAITIPWGDVATAYYTTGIPNIEVYAAVPPMARYGALAARAFAPLLATSFVQRLLQRRINARPPGPSNEELERGASFVWGRVEDEAGNSQEARFRGPNGYLLTAHTALTILKRVLTRQFSAGFQTPARQYGSGLVLEVGGTSIT